MYPIFKNLENWKDVVEEFEDIHFKPTQDDSNWILTQIEESKEKMEQAKSLVNQHSSKLQYVYLIGAGIAALNTLCRADYNFIIYLYMFYVWKFMENSVDSQAQEKVASFFILLYSLLIDFFWCFFWGAKWGNLMNDPEGGIHKMVIFLSWIGILLKIVALFMIGVLDWQSIKSAVPAKLQEKLNNNEGFMPQQDEIQP